MSTLRIVDAPLLSNVDGTEKIPTGGRGDYAISVDQIKDHIFQNIGKELVGLGNVDNTSDLDKPVSTAQQAALDLKADKTYVDVNLNLKADKTNVYTRTETTFALSNKADLVSGVIPESQIPSSFNDVLEFTTANLPVIGESGKIYVTTDTNKTWRWATNKYVEISGWNPDSVSKVATLPTYYAKEDGVDPLTGVAGGAYFNVRSTDDDTMLVEYQNVDGSAVATGKRYPSSTALMQVKQSVDAIINPETGMVDAENVFDGSDSLKTLNNKFKNRIVYFEDHVSDVTGTVDVTAEMQSLLDSHDGDIYAKSTSIFKTSNTLFNKKHNRTIDFHNAQIVNKANSRYAIVTISPAFTGSTDAELNTFITERHYGKEVKFSHVVNLRYEMSANTGGGNNLGAGIVYGYKCKLSRMFPSMTNGNGVEIRNSLRCGLYRSEILGHRNYTCFVFMSQRCEIIGNKFKGGARGVCTKMNRDGDSYCGHIIAFNTFEDATTSGRVIIGGEWRETTLTHEIYVPGHEWVDGNEVYGNTFINIAQPQTISMCVFSRNWNIYDNTFKWNNLSGSIFNIGGEGNPVAGEKLGGGHDVYDNYLYDYNTAGNAIINARLSSRVFNNHFFNCRARHMYYAQADIAGNKLDYAKFFANNFHGDQNGIYCNISQNHGFTVTEGVKNFSFNENAGILNILASGSYTSAVVVASSADTTNLQGGDLNLIANTGVNSVTGAIVYRGTVRDLTGRKVEISAPATAIGLQLQSGVIVESKHESNTYVLNGVTTTARAVVNNTDFVDGVNSYIGAWSNRIFNNFEKPVGLLRTDRQSSVMPTTGMYAKGDFVRNINPSITANSVVFGWLRITDGDNHVLNVDWVEIKQSTV